MPLYSTYRPFDMAFGQGLQRGGNLIAAPRTAPSKLPYKSVPPLYDPYNQVFSDCTGRNAPLPPLLASIARAKARNH
jgi:hypothetical protein